MTALLPVEGALARVLDGVEPLASETIPLADAWGRVLAADLAALRSQPPAAVSSMDGYAVRSSDLIGGRAELRVVAEVPAGSLGRCEIGPGEAARIFTGAVLPAGADAVVVQEHAERRADYVTLVDSAFPGKNIRPEALDFARGEVLLRHGRRLSARDLALAAAMNHATVPVRRRPKVAILATGDELVTPGCNPGPHQIVSTNAFSLSALARRAGADTRDFGIVRDRLEETTAGLRRMRDWRADVLVTTGGASVGEHDLIRAALTAEGAVLAFWKIAMRPGRPMMYGSLPGARVLGLPGNPVSAYVCGLVFLVPLLRRLLALAGPGPSRESVELGRDLAANDERADYLRAKLDRKPDGTLVATPFPVQDSSMLTPLAQSDCLIIREPYETAARAGAQCVIVKLWS
jgi:molybdopterin molybdotransferase